MQRFSTSDNHEELGSNLEKLRYHDLNPYLCLSDDPRQDESLLKRCFPNLKIVINDEMKVETIPENLEKIPCNKQILCAINILTMTSNVVKYTIVLKLYNFRCNTHHL